MTAGAISLAILLSMPGQAADIVHPMKGRMMQFPVAIKQPDVVELRLFVSGDDGHSWTQAGTGRPGQEAMVYTAPTDGPYSFVVQAVFSNGRIEPADVYKVKPTQRVIIDTVKPVIRFTQVTRQGEELALGWEIQDAALNLETFKLEYKSANDQFWLALPTAAQASGSGRFRLNTTGPVTVRLQVNDQAGNLGELEQLVQAAGTTMAFSPSQTPVPAPIPAPILQANASIPPTPTPSPVGNDSPFPVAPPPTAPSSPAPAPNFPPAAVATSPLAPVEPLAPAPIASSNPVETPRPPITAAPVPAVVAGPTTTDVQFVNELTLTLDYEVERQGASGVGRVEVWLTSDDGRRWTKYQDIPRTQLGRPDINTPNKLPVTFDLPKQDGLYGVRLVLVSGVSQSVGAPQPGDAPELRVQLDRTRPQVALFKPRPDDRQPNALVLSWSARDENLSDAPIHLYWSTNPRGDWQPIGPTTSNSVGAAIAGAGNPSAPALPNTGSYTWLLPANPPLEVYLRITAEDRAGNVNEAITTLPEKVDLLKPTGAIRGIIRKR